MERPDQLIDIVHQVALWSLPILAAVIFHEVAHGAMALRLGDDTASRIGRLTLNPLPHIDPIGTSEAGARLRQRQRELGR